MAIIIIGDSTFSCRQRHDLLAAGGNAVPHLELIFADYADLESCVECVSLVPPPLPPMQQLLQIKLCHSFTVRKVKPLYKGQHLNNFILLAMLNFGRLP